MPPIAAIVGAIAIIALVIRRLRLRMSAGSGKPPDSSKPSRVPMLRIAIGLAAAMGSATVAWETTVAADRKRG